jgi:prepilin-type N-terminal cleavage/methylation domain-containing protein
MRHHSARVSHGFTLVEVLIATAILSLLVILLASLVSAVNRAWISGEQQVSEFQDGRAVLELISRELSQAIISPRLQLVQNPVMPAGLKLRANSDTIFWQAPIASGASGNLAEVGYFLVEDNSTPNSGAEIFQLKRFFVPPSDPNNYQIFSNPPSDSSAPWVSSYVNAPVTTSVASGVVALWIRCFDINGDLIPWLLNDPGNVGQVGTLKFNSAAHFQPAIPGRNSSFLYTDRKSTAQAHALPASIEVTIVTVDSRTFKRSPSIPPQTVQSGPDDLPTIRDSFNQQLISKGVANARTFSARTILRRSQ